MKLHLTAVAFFAFATTAHASYWTGNDLKDACQRTPSFVTGYVTGWIDRWSQDTGQAADGEGSSSQAKICMSRKESANQLSSAYCRYLAENPEQLSEAADTLLLAAYGKAYPCVD